MSKRMQASPTRKHSPSSRKESPKKQKSIPKQKRKRRKSSSQSNQSTAKRLRNEEEEDRKRQQEEHKQLQQEWQRNMAPVLRERQQSIDLGLAGVRERLYGCLDYYIVETMKSNEKPPEKEIFQFFLDAVEIIVDGELHHYDEGVFKGIAQEKRMELLQEIEKEPKKWLAGRIDMFINAYGDMWGKDLAPSSSPSILYNPDEEDLADCSEESDVDMNDEE
jgi:hypothetical protein